MGRTNVTEFINTYLEYHIGRLLVGPEAEAAVHIGIVERIESCGLANDVFSFVEILIIGD